MKLRYLAKTIIFFTLPLTIYACSEKNWPELSPLSEFENKFFNSKNDTTYCKNMSLLNCFDNINETIFVDRSHTADKGYKIISEKISDFIFKNIN